ncbi:MAG: M3 family metallopeptidase [Flavobacteriaceae bacterium]|nr:M3 family metallopeptidase [Flavobacteriaceae bacterium]
MKKIMVASLIAVVLTSCKTEVKENKKVSENPLLKESTLPYGVPDFTKIKSEHFEPAFAKAMQKQSKDIDKIIKNTEKPSFENTILALEKSDKQLDDIRNIFFALTSANTDDVLKKTQQNLAPKLAEHKDKIYLNTALFEKVKTVYEQLGQLKLDAESKKLIENYYTDFAIAGANLSKEKKKKLKEINARLASLSTEFNQVLLEANNAGAMYLTEDEMKGVSEGVKKAKKEGDKYKIALLNTTQQPLLQSLENREIRKKLFNSSMHRADGKEHNTEDILSEMAILRAQKAAILGFPNYASWSMQKTMAKTPETVAKMYKGVIEPAVHKAKEEAKVIQKMITSQGGKFQLEPYDWNLYAEKVRKAKYDLDENQIKPYFNLKTVLEKGVFYVAEKLYGISFKERKDIPTYHPDVLVYELIEEDGSKLGLFYGDYFARDSKKGGAWMNNFVTQSKMYGKKPVIYNVCNYTKPAKGEPALLTYDEVSTLFHEFGHALHGFFANQQYPSLSGTSVARDFVEFPSQFNENWALYPEVLKNYAVHYKTGKVIPQSLIDKIKKAGTFNQGYSFTELLAAGNLDMQWHTIPAGTEFEKINVGNFEKEALKSTGLLVKEVPTRYRSTYFSHIFGGGYAAGYYSYLWTEMLAHDAYDWFTENNGLNRKNGQRFREMILSQGNTQDYKKMYKEFRGSDPKIEPLLKARGLK